MIDLAAATLVEFPLRGEWCAASTPAEQVPSHGTDYFGQRYAFDFFRVNPSTQTPYAGTFTKHLFGLVKVQDCFAWDQPVLACFDGEAIEIGDGWSDRQRLNYDWDMLRIGFFAQDSTPQDYRPLVGNYVMLQG